MLQEDDAGCMASDLRLENGLWQTMLQRPDISLSSVDLAGPLSTTRTTATTRGKNIAAHQPGRQT